MAKRKHLQEGEIQRLERLDDAALEKELTDLSPRALTERFAHLLVAYRLTAHVANRAFGYVKERSKASEDALLAALHDYAPAHFPPAGGHQEEMVEILMDLYDLRGSHATGEELREELYRKIETLQPPPGAKGST